ncbi:hypothetical protein ACFUIT_34640 [Streptomyces sp. NPDC057239]|uniref:hypothetical protein n=1 Tax=Streptomyces sp. NPDC057239 TaxID=3346061 RepID=UPI003629E675
MKFRIIANDEDPLTVLFEPVAEEIEIFPGDYIVVEWVGSGFGEICPENGYLMVGSPMGGDMRAWRSDGREISIF